MDLEELAKKIGCFDVEHLEKNIENYGEPLLEWWEAIKDLQPKSDWVSVEDGLPEGIVLISAIGRNDKNFVLRAMFIKKFSEEDNGEFVGESEYNPEDDQYYYPEGWYEMNENEETNWSVNNIVTHWQPLPQPPKTK